MSITFSIPLPSAVVTNIDGALPKKVAMMYFLIDMSNIMGNTFCTAYGVPPPPINRKHIKYKVSFSVKLSGNRAYSDYQNMLVKEIKKLRKKGFMYKDIVEYLKGRGFKSSRGKELSVKLVERMLKKKKTSDEKKKIQFMSIQNFEIIQK